MGIPSSSEDNSGKAEEAAFMDKPMAPDLAKILAAPVNKAKMAKTKSKPPKKGLAGTKRQQREIARLTDENRRLRGELEAEKQHVSQLRQRLNCGSRDLLRGAEIRHLKDEIIKRDEEIVSLRKLVMRNQID